MLLIIAHHYVVNSGVIDSVMVSPQSVNSTFLLIFGMWGKIGINCFVMITGYFMCDRNITIKKFAKLVCEWLFYKYIILAIFFISGYRRYTFCSFIKACIPITQIDKKFHIMFFDILFMHSVFKYSNS